MVASICGIDDEFGAVVGDRATRARPSVGNRRTAVSRNVLCNDPTTTELSTLSNHGALPTLRNLYFRTGRI